MKAVYPSLSYTLFIVISIAAVSMILISVNDFSQNVQNNYARSQLNYAADIIRNEILEVYSLNVEGRFEVSVPKNIIGKQYTVEIGQDTLTLSLDTGRNVLQVERRMNIGATFYGGRTYAPVFIEATKQNGDLTIGLI